MMKREEYRQQGFAVGIATVTVLAYAITAPAKRYASENDVMFLSDSCVFHRTVLSYY
jgi:hypothetical protein